MKYSRIMSAVMSTPWAMRADKLMTIVSFLRFKADGGEVSAEEIALVKQPAKEPIYIAMQDAPHTCSSILLPEAVEAAKRECAACQAAAPGSSSRSKAGSIAVLPISGTISHRTGLMSDMSGGTSTEKFTQWLRAAVADPSVKAIVLDIDSPGGTVDGVPELADEIYKANQSKPVTAVANTQAASAAYWLGSQAKEFVVTPSGEVGSIGVFGAHEDMSQALDKAGVKVSLVSAGKYKTEGNPFEPLSDEARGALQDSVNSYYDMFTRAVARGRQSDQQSVQNGFGQGRMIPANKAVKMGMADRVATLDQTLARLGARTPMPGSAAKAETDLEIVAGPFGNCDTPHHFGDATPDHKALIQNAHTKGTNCKGWREVTADLKAAAVPHGDSDGKDDSDSWDGPAAENRLAKWASSDGSGDKDKMDWAKYRRGFAWYDSSNPDAFGSYKLPHHDIEDGKFVVVWGGVAAAMASLLGSRGGTSIPEADRKAVYDHLAAEYKLFDKTPPDFHSEQTAPKFDAAIALLEREMEMEAL